MTIKRLMTLAAAVALQCMILMLQEAEAQTQKQMACVGSCLGLGGIPSINTQKCKEYEDCTKNCFPNDIIPANVTITPCKHLPGGAAATQEMQPLLLLLPLAVAVVFNILNRM